MIIRIIYVQVLPPPTFHAPSDPIQLWPEPRGREDMDKLGDTPRVATGFLKF